MLPETARDLFANFDSNTSMEAALYLKRSGVGIAAWSRSPTSQEVLTVMSAATLGSIETILENLGGASPRELLLETPDYRLFFAKVEPQKVLLLAAPTTVAESVLRREAWRILRRIDELEGKDVQGATPRSPGPPLGAVRPKRVNGAAPGGDPIDAPLPGGR